MPALLDRLTSAEVKDRRQAASEAGAEDALDRSTARALIELLRDPDPAVRLETLRSVASLVHRAVTNFEGEAERRALELIADPHAPVRAEAAVVLALVEVTNMELVLRALLGLLEDPAEIVRREAAAALGDLGQATAGPLLAKHLDEEDLETRFECAFALASLRDARGLPLLLAALADDKRRLDALEGLRRLGSREALPALERLARKTFLAWPDRLTVSATRYALGERDAAEHLITRLKAWSREERILALGLIASHHVREAREAIAAIAQDPRSPIRENAQDALDALDES